MEKDKSVWPAALCLILVLVLGFFITAGAITNSIERNSQAKIDLSNLATKGDLKNLQTTLENEIANNSANNRLNDAANEILSTPDEKTQVLDLATAYLEDRDFKKALVEYLNDNELENQSIESYKDIEVIIVKDSDLSYHDRDNSAQVDYSLKVTYFNDGDNDLEDAVKAKVDVTLNLENLDEDENFSDIEFSESDFALVKVY